jgi:acylphosphatase
METVAKYILFKGSVQGIGFRYTAHRIAARYELTGYVRNLDDGSVEMLAQGYPEDIENCIADIRETFGNYIRKVEIEDRAVDGEYREFMIRV